MIDEAFTVSVKLRIRAVGAEPLLINCMLNAISCGGVMSGMIVLAITGLITPVKTFPLMSAMLPFSMVINVLLTLIPALPSALMLLMSSSSSTTVRTLSMMETSPF